MVPNGQIKPQKTLPEKKVRAIIPKAHPKPLIHLCPDMRDVIHIRGSS